MTISPGKPTDGRRGHGGELSNYLDQASDLNTAAVAARGTGASWDAIGRAAKMSRQSAHERWSGCDLPFTQAWAWQILKAGIPRDAVLR